MAEDDEKPKRVFVNDGRGVIPAVETSRVLKAGPNANPADGFSKRPKPPAGSKPVMKAGEPPKQEGN